MRLRLATLGQEPIGKPMFDFFQFLQDHKLADTVTVLLMIAVGMLLYREISNWIHHRNQKDQVVEESSSTVKRVEDLMKQHIKRAESLCDGKNCANFEKIAASFYDLRDTILQFERDSKQSRNVTSESIQRIERNITSFINDLGREMIRFMREGGKHDRDGNS